MPLSAKVKNAKQKVLAETEVTCQAHPLLKQGNALPRSVSFEISPQELFGIATLRTQSPETGNFTYDDCYKGWPYLLGIYIKYLPPEENRALRRKAVPLIAGLLEEGFIELDEEETLKEKNRGDNLGVRNGTS